ncbi:hypothetical protein C0583_06930 [Candidatus Parcubacteria bacterium]|nr:MAG: hypothetical protein C0583_06930 [Candidatus Parcubacteria bacterium]
MKKIYLILLIIFFIISFEYARADFYLDTNIINLEAYQGGGDLKMVKFSNHSTTGEERKLVVAKYDFEHDYIMPNLKYEQNISKDSDFFYVDISLNLPSDASPGSYTGDILFQEVSLDGKQVYENIELSINYTINEKLKKCRDSDGGDMTTIKGQVLFEGKYYKDVCTNSKELIEYFCENDTLKHVGYFCDDICEDGACVVRASSVNRNDINNTNQQKASLVGGVEKNNKKPIDNKFLILGFIFIVIGISSIKSAFKNNFVDISSSTYEKVIGFIVLLLGLGAIVYAINISLEKFFGAIFPFLFFIFFMLMFSTKINQLSKTSTGSKSRENLIKLIENSIEKK